MGKAVRMQIESATPWNGLTLRQRCKIVAGARFAIARQADNLSGLCISEQRTDAFETVTAELIPLCDALKYLAKKGATILASRQLGVRGRPLWLWGVRSTVRRAPHGTVLIIGTWNYPLLLTGVQVAQALAAGNRVLLKPAEGCEALTRILVRCFYDAGVPEQALVQLDSSPTAAASILNATTTPQPVDLVVLTGSANTGRKVLEQTAKTLTPAIMELSGCDAVVVLPGADLDRVCSFVKFGLNLNSGATCIGPRRLLVEDSPMADAVVTRLCQRLDETDKHFVIHPVARAGVAQTIDEAISGGAIDATQHYDAERLAATGEMRTLVLDRVPMDAEIVSADLFAPVISVVRLKKSEDAVAAINQCRYRLAASVFGPRRAAIAMANQLNVGSVAINEMITPTADPRVPFGGRGSSGFGVTRGDEGLLAMTVPVVVSERRGRFALHHMPQNDVTRERLIGALQLRNAQGLKMYWLALRRMLS